ncbi:MAG: MFS transporter [Akkermansiaceae bacterium]|jgi:maltose/moltooligosaccharide transporter|nr:MFS transporter [Akkermansiaceae bacterium]
MSEKPRLSFWQIWNMSFGFLGIQFGMALQMANMSSIYSFLGAKEEDLSLLWIAAPLTGLIVQPVIGYLSDRTWCGLGRRRPYFLIGALLSSLALVAMPHSSVLWMAVGLLWILDASLNITMEPFRAFVADKLPDDQRPTGFTVQSLFIGLGATVASALPWLLTNVFHIQSAPAGEGVMPSATILSFHIGAGVLFVAVLYTILTSSEKAPEDMAAFEKMKRESAGVAGFFRELLHGLQSMPQTMKQLAVVQFFTWMGLFCMWVYFSPTIARNVFNGNPSDEAGWKAVMEKAGEWTGMCFAAYNVVCFAFSFVLLALTRKFSAKTIHMACLVCGAAGLLSASLITSQSWLMASMLGVGIAWASILSMPYAMLSSALPAERMGFYMGVFNFFIVLPQILVSLAMGRVVGSVFGGDSTKAVLLGGVFFFLAAISTRWVSYKGGPVGVPAGGGH